MNTYSICDEDGVIFEKNLSLARVAKLTGEDADHLEWAVNTDGICPVQYDGQKAFVEKERI